MRLPELDTHGITYRFLGTTALDHFFELPHGPVLFAEVDTDVVEIASVMDEPSFPGLLDWDIAIFSGGRDVLIRSPETGSNSDPLSAFSWSPHRRAFGDPYDLYSLLKEVRSRIWSAYRTRGRSLFDVDPVDLDSFVDLTTRIGTLPAPTAAVLSARYPILIPDRTITPWSVHAELPSRFHRDLLGSVLSGPWAGRGLDILYRTGYIEDILPELAHMNRTEQSKEGHPEGNVWNHTLETLGHRKQPDLLIGTALLLHDCGKPEAVPVGRKRFYGHADIGADIAGTVLRRLGYGEEFITSVRWLIRYHMIPGALRRLPPHRRDPIMSSELFPFLLEVYRCDLSSTFRGPDNYYDACTVYRRYLKTDRGRASRPHRQRMELYVD